MKPNINLLLYNRTKNMFANYFFANLEILIFIKQYCSVQ